MSSPIVCVCVWGVPHPEGSVLSFREREQVPVYFVTLKQQAWAWMMLNSPRAKAGPLPALGSIMASHSTDQTQLGKGASVRSLELPRENCPVAVKVALRKAGLGGSQLVPTSDMCRLS